MGVDMVLLKFPATLDDLEETASDISFQHVCSKYSRSQKHIQHGSMGGQGSLLLSDHKFCIRPLVLIFKYSFP